MAATAPAQKTFPTTAASASIDLASGRSVSRRAAISACTESGNGTSAPSRSSQLEPRVHQQTPILQQADEFLREEWVAAGALQDLLLQLGGDHGSSQQRRHQPRGLVLREGRQVDRCGVAQPSVVGSALEQLGPCGADDEQRHALGAIGQVLQEVQHRVVGPVQVLEDEHGRTVLRDLLEEPPPRGEQLLAFGRGRRLDTQQREQPLAEPRLLGAVGQDRVELALRDVRRVGLEDARVRLHDLPERPERDALAVGHAAPLPPRDQLGTRVDVRGQLAHDATLAEPRLSHDRHELHRRRRHRLVEDPLEQCEVDLPADERGVVGPREVGAQARPWPQRVEHPHRLGLPLQRRGLELLVVEDRRGRLVRGLADRDAHLGRDRLQARGRVHGVAGEEPLARARRDAEPHERLPGVDADPKPQRCAADGLEGVGVLHDPQGRADGALGVVLVCRRHAEDAVHRVADELLHHAAVALDLGPHHGEVRGQHPADVLRVGRLRRGGEAGQVAEERRDDLALLGHLSARRGQGRSAFAAELLPVEVLVPACVAGGHRSSLLRTGHGVNRDPTEPSPVRHAGVGFAFPGCDVFSGDFAFDGRSVDGATNELPSGPARTA